MLMMVSTITLFLSLRLESSYENQRNKGKNNANDNNNNNNNNNSNSNNSNNNDDDQHWLFFAKLVLAISHNPGHLISDKTYSRSSNVQGKDNFDNPRSRYSSNSLYQRDTTFLYQECTQSDLASISRNKALRRFGQPIPRILNAAFSLKMF